RRSDDANVLSLRALGAAGDLELHPLVLLKAAEAARRDGRVVREVVRTTVLGRDEPKALFRVEPLHSADCHAFSFGVTGATLLRGPTSRLNHPVRKTSTSRAPCFGRSQGHWQIRPQRIARQRYHTIGSDRPPAVRTTRAGCSGSAGRCCQGRTDA